MKHTTRLAAGLPAALTLALVAGLPASASADSSSTDSAPAAPASPSTSSVDKAWGDRWAYVNIFSFSDFHGHLEANDPPMAATVDPTQTPVGGAAHLAANIDKYKGSNGITVSAGDNIGGSTFLSGIFHDEPTIEVLDQMDVKASSVGNHEFDEGLNELLRMQHGGSHWKDGSYFPGKPYPGADMQYLASNVTNTKTGRRPFPATYVEEINGVKVGFIGAVTEETPSLVSPGGVSSVRFDSIASKVNSAASWLSSAKDVETIVVLLHEGGAQEGTFNECSNLSGPVVELNKRFNSRIDGVVTGHTHNAFNCTLTDWKGGKRPVVASEAWGRGFNQMRLLVDRKTGDVAKQYSTATNRLNTRATAADPDVQAIVDTWSDRAGPERAKVVGTVAEDITGDASGDRGIETPMADLVADSILWGTKAPEDGGAQISFMNVGGVRSSFLRSTISNGEDVGEITYEEAYKVAPFGNLLVSIDMTGEQIKAVLEQQYDGSRGRKKLALGVSKGFTYTWDQDAAQGSRVSDMKLDGEAIDLTKTYRVSTLNFLQQGGDSFTAFEQGTNLQGGPEDLENLVRYLGAHENLTAPEDRVSGL